MESGLKMSEDRRDIDKDFESSSLEELQQMQAKLEKFVTKRLASKKKEALIQIQRLVLDHELTFEEVTSSIRTTAKRGKAPPLYRSPENWRVTWSGKGEAPDWYTTHPDPESLRMKTD
jgi:DNA-binding protein H-NS